MGGGDAKLFSVLALYIHTPELLLTFVIVMTLVGVVYGLVMLTNYKYAIIHTFDKIGVELPVGLVGTKRVPMGIAFAVAGIGVIAPTLL